MQENTGKSKASKDSYQWYKRDARAFYEGTRQLPLEARGAYSDIIDLIYIHNGPIPDDDRWMGHALHISTRKWRAVRKVLIEAGKIVCEDGLIANHRAGLEIETRSNRSRTNRENALSQSRTNSEPTPNQPRASAENSKKTNDFNKIKPNSLLDTRASLELEEELELEIQKKESMHASFLEDLMEEIWQATAGCMMDDFQDVAIVKSWLSAGADPQADIVATIRQKAIELRADSIEHYGYFSGAVREAIADRKAGKPNRHTVNQRETPEEYMARRIAEEMAAGTIVRIENHAAS